MALPLREVTAAELRAIASGAPAIYRVVHGRLRTYTVSEDLRARALRRYPHYAELGRVARAPLGSRTRQYERLVRLA